MMKRWKSLILAAVCVCAVPAFGHGLGNVTLVSYKNMTWTPLQFGLWPFQICSYRSNVYGLNADLLLTYTEGNVYGLSLAPFCSMDYSCGVTVAVISSLTYNKGWQIGLANFCALSRAERGGGIQLGLYNESDTGLQIGLVNKQWGGIQLGLYNESDTGLQIGLLNHNPNAWLPWCPLFNWSAAE